jgi:precorrin-2 dehydrogenase/sirohydrochlorin ferrochelatase
MTTNLDYPVCMRLQGKRVLLVGGGHIAEARAEQLLGAGATLHVIASRPGDGLRSLAAAGALVLEERPYAEGDTEGYALVFVATSDRGVSRRVACETQARGQLLNASDEPQLCDFTLPSVGRRGPITLAVSTSGVAPALAALLRRRLERSIASADLRAAHTSAWLRTRMPRGPKRTHLLKRIALRLHEGDNT